MAETVPVTGPEASLSVPVRVVGEVERRFQLRFLGGSLPRRMVWSRMMPPWPSGRPELVTRSGWVPLKTIQIVPTP